MASSYETRLGNAPEEGIKAPVAVATNGAITLAGEQTVNTVAVVEGDRVLVRNQADPAENGIYDARVGAWVRSKDWNRANDVTNGVLVVDSHDGSIFQAFFSGDWEADVTEVTFSVYSGPGGGVIVLDTFADLRSQNPALGEWVQIKGHTAISDDGLGNFNWNASDTTADDDGAIAKYAALVTGRWQRVVVEKVNPVMWGGDHTGTTNSADAWQAMCDYIEANGPKEVVAIGTYLIEKTVNVAKGVNLCGLNPDVSILKSVTGNNYKNSSGSLVAANNGGFMFWLNINSGGTSWESQFPNLTSGCVQDFKIDGSDTSGTHGFYFAGSHQFRRIQCTAVNTLIEKPSVYADHVLIEDIHHDSTTRPNQTDYLVYVRGLGDGLQIRNVVAGKTSAGDEGLGLYVGSCKGGRVMNLINGVHTFENSGPGFTVSNAHMENGYFELDSFNGTVHDNWFYVTEDLRTDWGSPIQINNDLGTTTQSRSMPVIENNRFVYPPNFKNGWPTADIPDINTNGWPCMVRGNYRQITVSGNVSRSQVMGAMVGSGSTIYSDWKNYAHILSHQSMIVNSGHVPISGTVNVLKTFTGWTSGTLATTSFSAQSWTWGGSSTTYYYAIQLLADPVRLVGKNASTAETSGALTVGGNIASPQIAQGILDTRSGYVYRIYRGTTTNSYDAYVDLPAYGLVTVYDDFDACNGFNWISRSAGPVDTLNDTSIEGPISYTEGVVTARMVSTTIPTVGTWQSGDIIHRDTFGAVPSVGATSLAQVTRITTGSGHVDGTDWIKWVFERG